MRCRAIADAFRDLNWEVKIYLHWNGPNCPNDSDLTIFNWHTQPIAEFTPRFHLALVDSYLAEALVYESIARKCLFVCAIDDYNRLVYPVSMVLNPGITNGRIDYSNQMATVFEGKSFILLRAEIRAASRAVQVIHRDLEAITITVGGSDVHKLLPRIGNLVKEAFPDAKVRIIHPDSQQANVLRQALPNVDILGLQSASEMVRLFQSSDLVISACGQTLHELAYLGTPLIGILTGEDQRYNQNYYIENGILKEELRYDDSLLDQKILKQLEALQMPERRNELANQLPELVARNGAANARDKIIGQAGL
jgi:spore coat polysaccharide biosynthesis predicted glycosyltransferase SpsG